MRIAELEPDIALLQELDVGRSRSRGRDQAALIAKLLNFESHFHPAMRWHDEHYGNAILSRWPVTPRRAAGLPSEHAFLFRESRAAQWVEVATPAGPLQLINTHLGVGRHERLEQAQALVGRDWLGAIRGSEPTLLLGDLNSLPGSGPHALLAGSLDDLVKQFLGRHLATFPALWPLVTLDHVFGNARIHVTRVDVPGGWTRAVVSDHLPVVMDFEVVEGSVCASAG